jgi:hypothetical protein
VRSGGGLARKAYDARIGLLVPSIETLDAEWHDDVYER